MTQTSMAAAGVVPAPAPSAPDKLGLPDAIAAALPPDPYEQLEVARKITAVAVAARASRLELEAARLRQRLVEKDRLAASLAEKAATLDQALRDADARHRAALDDNAKLAKERDSFAQTSKKLARELAKLETFKRHLMQSLGDPVSPHQETVDIRTCEQSVAKSTSWKDGLANNHPSSTLADASTKVESKNQELARPFEQKLSITHMTPRLASDSTPKLRSAAGSPRRYSTAVSPKLASRAASPTHPRLECHMAMSPWFPSSKMSSAASSPPRGHSISGRTPRVDGKEFFRLARSRLSYEQFAAFLANIKELNSHTQSREETLKKADQIFGPDNKDLFLSFQGLLSRSLS